LEGKKLIIDIHTRIGGHPIHEFKQKPEQLLKIMEENNISKSFLLPFPTMKIKENNDLIINAVNQNPDQLIGFAGVDPSSEDFEKEIK
jgi:predicted TIM-barrel fold metal-dependent hydrolase